MMMEKDLSNTALPEATDKPVGGVLVPKFQGQYHQPDSVLVIHMLGELHYLVKQWQTEINELEGKIKQVLAAGPVVAGWIEPTKDVAKDLTTPSENLPPQDYQLCSLDENGQVASRDCPPPEMFGISKALARHQQLQALRSRKETLETHLKHALASLVQLRMDVN